MSSYQDKANNPTILSVNKIHVTYDGMDVVKDMNLHVNKGEFISVIGPSGCGKSTLFHVIAGLLEPDSGDVKLEGESILGLTNKVAYMYQKDLLLPWKKIIDNVAVPFRIVGLKKKESREKVKPYFETFDLKGFEDFYPHQLSGGMKQRASLMRTYMCKKDMMLLDEPFGRLDAMTRLKMQQWLKKVMDKINGSILFITHDIEEAIYLSDRIYVLSPLPATILKEIKVDLNKENFEDVITSQKFNDIKSEILQLMNH